MSTFSGFCGSLHLRLRRPPARWHNANSSRLRSILGSVVIAVNGPSEQGSTTIQAFQSKFVSVGFLVWGGICIAAALGMM